MTEEMAFDEWIKKIFKPCPFCGSIPNVISMECEQGFISRLTLSCCMKFEVECDEVIAHTNYKGEEEYLMIGLNPIGKWNRRTNE